MKEIIKSILIGALFLLPMLFIMYKFGAQIIIFTIIAILCLSACYCFGQLIQEVYTDIKAGSTIYEDKQNIEVTNNQSQEKLFQVSITAEYLCDGQLTTTQEYSAEEFNNKIIYNLLDLLNNYSKKHQLIEYPDKDDLFLSNKTCHSLIDIQVIMIGTNGNLYTLHLK